MLEENVGTVSQLLKSISHPLRLKILCLLQDGEQSVGDLQAELRTTTANISQHLALLRHQGIVKSRKNSNFIYNSIADRRVIKLIDTLQDLFC
jgi:ArsR family transcriptional regulator